MYVFTPHLTSGIVYNLIVQMFSSAGRCLVALGGWRTPRFVGSARGTCRLRLEVSNHSRFYSRTPSPVKPPPIRVAVLYQAVKPSADGVVKKAKKGGGAYACLLGSKRIC